MSTQERRYIDVPFENGTSAKVLYTPTPGELALEQFARDHGLGLTDATPTSDYRNLLSYGYTRGTIKPHNGLLVMLNIVLGDDNNPSKNIDSSVLKAVRYLVPGVRDEDLPEMRRTKMVLRPDNVQAYGALLASSPCREEVVVENERGEDDNYSFNVIYVDGFFIGDEMEMNAAEQSLSVLIEQHEAGLHGDPSPTQMHAVLRALGQFDPSLLR